MKEKLIKRTCINQDTGEIKSFSLIKGDDVVYKNHVSEGLEEWITYNKEENYKISKFSDGYKTTHKYNECGQTILEKDNMGNKTIYSEQDLSNDNNMYKNGDLITRFVKHESGLSFDISKGCDKPIVSYFKGSILSLFIYGDNDRVIESLNNGIWYRYTYENTDEQIPAFKITNPRKGLQ